MRLNKKEISLVTNKIIDTWIENNAVQLSSKREDVERFLNQTFEAELLLEDDLNKSVEEVLEAYNQQFDSGALDRKKMFAMVKKQLAKETYFYPFSRWC